MLRARIVFVGVLPPSGPQADGENLEYLPEADLGAGVQENRGEDQEPGRDHDV
jgi:hypothetical protein